jgi:hypothetical protein
MNVLDNMSPSPCTEEKLRQLIPATVSEAGLERMDAVIDQLSGTSGQNRDARAGVSGDGPDKTLPWHQKAGWRAAAIVVVLILPIGLISIKSWPTGGKAQSPGAKQVASQSSAVTGEGHDLAQSTAADEIQMPSTGENLIPKAVTGGNYCGLLISSTSNQSVGSLTAIVPRNRSGFSGRVSFGNRSYEFKGRFNERNRFSKVISDSGPRTIVELQREKAPSGAFTLVATVKRGSKSLRAEF